MSAAELVLQDGQWVLTVRLLPGVSCLEAAWEACFRPPPGLLDWLRPPPDCPAGQPRSPVTGH